MQNEAGVVVDAYLPRKCSITNRPIGAKDHASVQLVVAEVNEQGVYEGNATTYNVIGKYRSSGETDDSLNRLMQNDGLAVKLV